MSYSSEEMAAQASERALETVRDEGGDPTAQEIEEALRDSPVGLKLLELLELAGDIQQASDRRWGKSVENLRQRFFRQTPEERLAEAIINQLGPADDCWTLREVAARFV